SSKPRPVIVRFIGREKRLELLRIRRNKLKGSRISIHPDLTRPRSALLKVSQEKFKNRCMAWADFKGGIWREALGSEKKNVKKIELFSSRFSGIYSNNETENHFIIFFGITVACIQPFG